MTSSKMGKEKWEALEAIYVSMGVLWGEAFAAKKSPANGADQCENEHHFPADFFASTEASKREYPSS